MGRLDKLSKIKNMPEDDFDDIDPDAKPATYSNQNEKLFDDSNQFDNSLENNAVSDNTQSNAVDNELSLSGIDDVEASEEQDHSYELDALYTETTETNQDPEDSQDSEDEYPNGGSVDDVFPTDKSLSTELSTPTYKNYIPIIYRKPGRVPAELPDVREYITKYIAKKVIESVSSEYTSEVFTSSYIDKMIKQYMSGNNWDTPMFKQFIQELIDSNYEDEFMSSETVHVLDFILQETEGK